MSLAIGETNMFVPKIGKLRRSIDSLANKDEAGKPVVGPRNFTTKPLKKGKTENVYFSKASSYVGIGDPFKEATLQMRVSEKDGHLKAGHDKAFAPAKHVKQYEYKAPYPHQSDRVEVKKNYKDEDGKVKLEPRNFLTMPPKSGVVGKNTTFGGNLPHLPDPYDYGKEQEKKEFKEHLSKLQDKPFS